MQSGRPTTFVRLAGCNVGKPYTPAAREALGLQVFQERCTAWNGNSFACDTNYRVHKRMTVAELCNLDSVRNAHWVSLTGGEPLIHDIMPLVEGLQRVDVNIHLETSGTKPIPTFQGCCVFDWVVVSPKAGFLVDALIAASEIRVVVDETFNEDQFVETFGSFFKSGRVWVSPINGLNELDRSTMDKCLQLVQKHKHVRVSIQAHKIWKVR